MITVIRIRRRIVSDYTMYVTYLLLDITEFCENDRYSIDASKYDDLDIGQSYGKWFLQGFKVILV